MEAHAFDAVLTERIKNHSGWQSLESFGSQLGSKALSQRQLRIFLASTAHFFREIPGGILALALRVTDDRIEGDRFGAVRSAAHILLAAVDEYGLQQTNGNYARTHHELFADMAKLLGVTDADLNNDEYIISEARQLADCTRAIYRLGAVPAGVGFHFASEITSDREFQLCFEGLARYLPNYTGYSDGARPEDVFGFYYIHTIVEPHHGAASAEAVAVYAIDAEAREAMGAAADEFMQTYGAFWVGLTKALSD